MPLKDIVKSQRIRHTILKALSWLPDKWMLPLQYKAVLKRWPDLKNPRRFTEWLQRYKMKYRNPDMLQVVDKYKVREFVRERIGEEYLNELYQLCKDANEINFENLPDAFVIKTTDGGNGDNVLIVRDKNKEDTTAAIAKVNSWRGKKYETISREWAYTGAHDSKIIVERILVDPHSTDGSIDDYKFLCFNGKFKCLWVDKDRFSCHRRGFWDEKLNFMSDVVSDHPTFSTPPPLPENIQEMISLAERLAVGFPFVRVDFYNIEGKIVFGELTFYPWSGYIQFTPDSFDFTLGSYFLHWR